jgi:hypothetical protein
MPVVLIALGPNSIEIPCMIFEDSGEAEKICDEIFLPQFGEGCKSEITIKESICIKYEGDLEDLDDDVVSDKLFTNHYYGCGGPYRFIFKHVNYNTRFVGFDLD